MRTVASVSGCGEGVSDSPGVSTSFESFNIWTGDEARKAVEELGGLLDWDRIEELNGFTCPPFIAANQLNDIVEDVSILPDNPAIAKVVQGVVSKLEANFTRELLAHMAEFKAG